MILSNYNDIRKYRNSAGIYRFRNKINNKSYVGQSVTLGKRIREHLCTLRNTSRQHSIHKAILKYGIDNFEIEILTVFDNVENLRSILNQAEQIYIAFYDSFKNGYNETAGGDSTTGRKWTEEQRKHMREILSGRKRSPEYIDPRSKPVFIYNINTEKYFNSPCIKFVSRIVGEELSRKQIEACVVGTHKTTKGYMFAYSEKELNYKIEKFKNEQNANKSKKTI